MSTARKTLLFFDFITHYGGAQHSTVFLCNMLGKDFDVKVCDAYGHCQKYLAALKAAQISVHVLMPDATHMVIGQRKNHYRRLLSVIRQLPELLRLRRRLVAEIKTANPDAIWTNSCKALFLLSSSRALRKIPLVFYARGWYQRSEHSYARRWLLKNRADAVLAVSRPTALALENWQMPSDRIHVVHNTIDFDGVLARSKRTVHDPPPGADADFTIIVPAGLLRTKGQHVAIQAVKFLKDEGLTPSLWLAGDVSVGDTSRYDEFLRTLIGDYGLQKDVHLLGWRSDVAALMRMADIVVLPTHTEGLPRTLLEAMILKRPVIAPPVGGVTDLITDGETGLLTPVEDARSLATAIGTLRRNPELTDRMIENAYQHVHECFSPCRHLALVSQTFRKVIS